MIHPTAIIDPRAEIDSNVKIGPYSIIREHVVIGSGTEIGPHVAVDPYTTIGPDCRIFQFASIGATPQAIKFEGEKTFVKIGRGTIIREFVTINRGTGFGGGVTEVGEENFLMAYCHIAHDCKTGKQVILANSATLAGHITIEDFVTVGGLVAIHQFVRIGKYAYVGGKSAVVKDIPPYVIAAGDRATLHGLNKVGLKRRGMSEETLSALKKAYRILFRFGLTMNEAMERVKAEIDPTPEVAHLIEFIESSTRGITR
ncbi:MULTISPECIES: acyl-ACP--UDP-N-acetylglucosamine O-acyltransferase [Desulfococcus]|jgi:UDP-N-acetylglucosamine acyltransferase|uniref:Acyl-[acyl-carrier-protein]--UDP-N-acetylglucosamine O-acyltransferase n=1 Tax=Desulfococcus multivorans DSM 2059 TaxID=1121405 RepID=S7USS0_DESML|nr:acyl-ACP--UDP-N-acetylglucosamine O-acyltransferase [Desulfococcus multivorans]AOY58673.1 LpxA: acyl-[acyl-carrier-protein]--UDP-N-acetylglucosamine O-acyltransferase [Desulfococcus multivorans]AQV00962.1 acyl-[acyl-carrier-protein]--UDP-N-acetylglucosamine O-acyltransferase [Desulfococcus multivorans]EPR35328.1 Acyl-(acyl-carrier-protein)--UDP-N-acetylglucosamine O-acyltransferase [Desulfococcus multivorans DSM 2059]MDX9819402.1 acyl-ACP--UDP-N-acetylglucosamine O-acyltransferase [Desulfoco